MFDMREIGSHRRPSTGRTRYFAAGLTVAALLMVPVYMSRPAPAPPPAPAAVVGEQGPEGPQGIPGRDPTAEEIAAAVEAYLIQHPPPSGHIGPTGLAGAKGDPGRGPTAEEIAAAVAAYMAAHPPTAAAPTAGPDPDHTPAA